MLDKFLRKQLVSFLLMRIKLFVDIFPDRDPKVKLPRHKHEASESKVRWVQILLSTTRCCIWYLEQNG